MTDVEQKVVQMRFDDKEFDEKAKKTMKTLDKLNEKLSFDAVAKKSDAALNEMVDNVEKIADKAYTIVDRVIDKIKDSIANKIFNFLSDTIVGQVKSGWQKYSDMTKAVGTLAAQGHKIEEINEVLERLAFFSDETSYNFNKMLDNIGKFTAAGVNLSDAEQALEGIAGLAGLSGVNAERASIAMDQMAQAMGSYMKKQDWMSVQSANLDTMQFRQTAIDTAEALGTLKKKADGVWVSLKGKKPGTVEVTAQNFVESLTQGAWFTTDVMVETYKKYGSAVAKIKEVVDASNGDMTANDAIDKLKEDNKILLAGYKKQYKVTDEIAEKELNTINSVRKATDEEIEEYAKLHKLTKKVAESTLNNDYNAMLKDFQKRTHKTLEETERELEHWNGWTDSLGLKAFTNAQEARTFEDVINSVKEAVSSNWRSIYESIFGDYAEAKKLWTDMANGLVNIFAGRLYEIAAIFKSWKGLDVGEGGRTDLWQGLYAFAYGLQAIIENVREVWDKLISDGESGINVLSNITLKIKEAGFRFYNFVDSLINEGFFADITEALHNIKSFIDQIFGAFYQGVRDAVPGGEFFKGLLLDFAHILKELTSNFKLSDEAVDGLRRTFKGLTIILNKSKKTFVEILVKVILPVLNAVFSVLGNIVEVVLTITGTIGDIIEYFMPLDGETSALVTILEVLTDVLTTIVKIVGKGIMVALKAVVPLIGVVIGSVATLVEGLKELFTMKTIKIGGGENKLFSTFTQLKNKILEAWAPLESFNETINKYKNGKGLVNFLNLFADITEGIGNRLLLTVDAVVGFFEVLGESKFGKAFTYAIKVLRWFVRAGLWLFNNLFVPALKEIIAELGLTIESIKGIIEEDGILGLLHLIQEVFKTGIFGEIINTINLINGIIGGNGLGKLFSKGAKALESITSYFNAAKMNQAAEVMLKIVAAVALLYTLLALITFIPMERYYQMKEALVDFGIALGIVIGGVFVISAAAALAGGNLIAMAAGFVGVAVAIATALWALKNMVKFIEEVDVTVIDKGTEKLMEILSAYSTFIFKTLGPLVLVSAKWSGNIGGVGIAMAGMAASIWLLVRTLHEMNGIDPSEVQKLFESLSGIYLVIAAATSLMILASSGQDVHGISIAIASVGVAFAAIKMVLPLCKDIIAEKDVFLDGQAALATFGLFMLAFAASMYLVTSGVHGIITSMVSLLLFKAFANIMLNTILPAVTSVVEGLMDFSTKFAERFQNTSTTFNLVALGVFVAVILGILAFVYAITGAFRMLFDTWAELDTVSIVAIAVSVVGSLIIFSKLLIPAVQSLSDTVKGMSTGDFWSLSILLGLMILPVLAIMHALNRIIYYYSMLYGTLKNARFSVNIGIVNRQYNEISGMMTSIAIIVVGLYALMTGFMYLASKITFTDAQLSAVRTIFGWTIGLVLSTIVPLCFMFYKVITTLRFSLNNGVLSNVNKSVGPAGIFSKVEDTTTAIIKAIGATIQIVAFLLPAIVLVMGFVAKAVAEKGVVDNFIKAMDSLSSIVVAMMIGISILAGILAYMAKSNILETTATNVNNTRYFALAAVMSAMQWLVIGILGTISVIGVIALIVANTMGSDEKAFSKFKKSLLWMGGLVLGIMAAFIGFIYLLTNPLRRMTNIADPSTSFRILITILAGILGMVITISVIAFQLIPAIQSLQDTDFSKVLTGFLGTIVLAVLPALMMFVVGASNKMAGATATTAASVLTMLKILLGIVGPLVAMVFLVSQMVDLLKASQTLDPKQLDALKNLVLILMGFVVVAGVLGIVAGTYTPALAGIAVVAALCVAIGAMAALIAYAAREIYSIYKDWSGIQETIGKVTAAKNVNDYINGIESNLDGVEAAGGDLGNAAKTGAKKSLKSKSPSKEFEKLGKFCDQGLAQGINRNTKEVVRASKNLGELTQSVFADDLEIASPSKVFYKNGRFIVAGLQEGITSQKTSLSDTMSDLGESLASSINSGFENINIDIWGGKDPIETIKESLKDVDAGSILGKMLGLEDVLSEEDQAKVEKYQNELDEINKQAKANGGISPGAAQRASWLTAQIESLTKPKSFGEKLASKAWDGVKSFLNSDTVKELGKTLGIDISDGVSLDIFGADGKSGKLGEIIEKVKSGDWSSLGDSIGDSIGKALKKAVTTVLGPTGHRILSWVGIIDYDANDIMKTKQKESSDSKSVLQVGLKRFDELKPQLDSYTQKQIETLFGAASVNEISFPVGFDTDALISGISEDVGPRMKQFMDAIYQGGFQAVKDNDGTMQIILKREAIETIKALMETWGVASPSKVMEYIYSMVGEGAIEGFEEKAPGITKAIEDANSDQYRAVSLGLQAIDELAEGNVLVSPSIVPMVDTSGLADMDSFFGSTASRVAASLNYEGSIASLAYSQLAMANAMDSLRRDILDSLSKGEFVKVDVNSNVNDNNLFDHFVTIDRQEYNRTGRHAW